MIYSHLLKLRSTLLLLLLFSCSEAQEFMNKDSLLRLLPAAKEDSSKVDLLIHIGQQLEANEPEKAKIYYRSAGDLSRKIGYPRGVAKFIANYTYILNMQNLSDSSLFYNLQAVDICRQSKDSIYLAKSLFNAGSSYRALGKPEKTLEYYLEGQRLFEKINEPLNVAVINDLLCVLYSDLHQYDKALLYGRESVKISRENGIDDGRLGNQITNLGNAYNFLGRYTEATAAYKEGMEIGKRVNDQNMIATNLVNLGDVYLRTGEHAKLKDVYEQALKINREIGVTEGVTTSLRGLSIYYLLRGTLGKSKELALEGLGIATASNLPVERVAMLGQLANVSLAMNDVTAGLAYGWRQEALQDSILNQATRDKIAEMEKAYEVEQKDNKIRSLEKERKLQLQNITQKSNINSLLIAIVGAMILIGLLVYWNYLQKQKFQRQRIAELETEKKLAATEAVLQGQEQERYRLAKDLHDGLGGTLSGISFSFSNMKDNLDLPKESKLLFDRALDMLNGSIHEMRRVAHNLMPESLLHFGLDAALKDYCQQMNETGMVKVVYQSLGLDELVIEQNRAILIYRVIQELLNNTVKHAHAHQSIVQVSADDRKFSITVEDDGVGFDPAILRASTGIGWNNIKSRVEMLNGRVDIDSKPGKGTSVYIEIGV
jgi:signal transduction histidine kinase